MSYRLGSSPECNIPLRDFILSVFTPPIGMLRWHKPPGSWCSFCRRYNNKMRDTVIKAVLVVCHGFHFFKWLLSVLSWFIWFRSIKSFLIHLHHLRFFLCCTYPEGANTVHQNNVWRDRTGRRCCIVDTTKRTSSSNSSNSWKSSSSPKHLINWDLKNTTMLTHGFISQIKKDTFGYALYMHTVLVKNLHGFMHLASAIIEVFSDDVFSHQLAQNNNSLIIQKSDIHTWMHLTFGFKNKI